MITGTSSRVCVRGHPAEGPTYEAGTRHQLTLICDDLHATLRELGEKGIEAYGGPEDEGFGITVMLALPGGVEVMLSEPRNATAIDAAT